jgi:hypothetical protein
MATPLPAHRLIKPDDKVLATMTAPQRLDKAKRLFRKIFRGNEWVEEHNQYYSSKTLKYKQEIDNVDWTGGPIQCSRCICAKKNGQRCTRSVCIGSLICWQHGIEYLNVRAGQTKLKFNHERLSFAGLFACDQKRNGTAVIFKEGDLVCPYVGEFIEQDELDERYGEGDDTVAPYALNVGHGANAFIEDSALRRSHGSLANTILPLHNQYQWAAAGTQNVPNVKIDVITINGNEMAVLKAIRPIKNSQEIYCRSHDENGNLEYVMHGDEVKHTTKGYKPSKRCCKPKIN